MLIMIDFSYMSVKYMSLYNITTIKHTGSGEEYLVEEQQIHY